MDLKQAVAIALQVSLFLLVLSLGLESRWSDLIHVVRRPAMLVRALIAVNLIVPAVAITLCLLLPIAPSTKAGLVIMALSPLAPFAPVKMLKGDAERPYVIGAYAALIIAAVVILPLSTLVLKPLTPRGVTIPILLVATFVIKTVLLPLFLGIFVNSLWPRVGVRTAPMAQKSAMVILLPAALLILLRFAREFPSLVGDGTLAAILIIVAAGLVSGYALGGPEAANRKALGEAAATRHPGLAAAIAELNFDDSRVLSAIVLFLFASIIFSIACGWAMSELKAYPLHGLGLPDQ